MVNPNDDYNLSRELSDVLSALKTIHQTYVGPIELPQREWLRLLPRLEKCGCIVCSTMAKVIIAEVEYIAELEEIESR